MKKLGPTAMITAWASRLRHPQLFLLISALLVLDFIVPDPIPFLDEGLLALLTVLVGSLKTRGTGKDDDEPDVKNVTPPRG